ncbi:hypothetical protein FGO68_gene5278 [Halteria grandinella]|uniref:Uncharacterized protein n=1 Tax=Halteria grandinella TaxID=5974 RepID=A0A8J8NX56_HALGN|nr:hypothetical protein FGO68_gene5278 [Halteria grandinella]
MATTHRTTRPLALYPTAYRPFSVKYPSSQAKMRERAMLEVYKSGKIELQARMTYYIQLNTANSSSSKTYILYYLQFSRH